MRQIVLSLSCCDLQAPLGQGRPCNLWTPPHVPVGVRGPPQRGQDRARARGASPGFKGISAPAGCAAFSKRFLHWPQDRVGKAAEVES